MEKTYFKQLLDLYDECYSLGGIAMVLFKDSIGRCTDWIFSHHESEGCLENDMYVKRNLDFIKGVIDSKKK